MRSTSRILSLCVAVAAFTVASLSFTPKAQAIPIFYQVGDDIFEAGPLPPPLDKDAKLSGGKAGYKCQVFGLFWAYMYWWDCHGVAYQGDSYNSDPAVSAAVEKKYTQASMQMGPWGAYGRFVIALVIVGAIVGRLVSRKKA